MKSSIDKRKFLKPARTFAFALSLVCAQLPSEGSMQMNTKSTGPFGGGLGKNTSPSASASSFIRSSRDAYAVEKLGWVATAIS